MMGRSNQVSRLSPTYKTLALVASIVTAIAVPTLIAFGLYYNEIQVDLFMAICSFFAFTFGFQNVLIFLWKDKDFRTFVKTSINNAYACVRKQLILNTKQANTSSTTTTV
ncbi:uncharacterized protein LOC143446598 [Clavelina lepadiformis]|uniref:uncharacterized protein LOC143446598 n=1 Tax=Clavelina lepadiformis TaxID=159417 RepID=UPI0040418BAF